MNQSTSLVLLGSLILSGAAYSQSAFAPATSRKSTAVRVAAALAAKRTGDLMLCDNGIPATGR